MLYERRLMFKHNVNRYIWVSPSSGTISILSCISSCIGFFICSIIICVPFLSAAWAVTYAVMHSSIHSCTNVCPHAFTYLRMHSCIHKCILYCIYLYIPSCICVCIRLCFWSCSTHGDGSFSMSLNGKLKLSSRWGGHTFLVPDTFAVHPATQLIPECNPVNTEQTDIEICVRSILSVHSSKLSTRSDAVGKMQRKPLRKIRTNSKGIDYTVRLPLCDMGKMRRGSEIPNTKNREFFFLIAFIHITVMR